MSESTVTILIILVLAILMGLGIWYAVFQFNLCYPEVSDSWWYCFQHAFGE